MEQLTKILHRGAVLRIVKWKPVTSFCLLPCFYTRKRPTYSTCSEGHSRGGDERETGLWMQSALHGVKVNGSVNRTGQAVAVTLTNCASCET